MGTNLMSDVLTDLYFRQNIRFTKITGRLVSCDAAVNWIKSIPFYRDFPKYLNPQLPFTLHFFLLYNGYVISNHIPVEEIIQKYGKVNLDFCYTVFPK